MHKILALFIAVSFLLSCSNNQSGATTETKTDSSATRKDSANKSTESNTVTPPASNGQY